jgi:hypothetical protein
VRISKNNKKLINKKKRLCYFLFLRAGTGKSTLIKEIVQKSCGGEDSKSSYHLYLVNVDGKDTAEYKKFHPDLKSSSFDELKSVEKKSCIIVEDIIHITKKDEQKLRVAINYQAHHKTQKIICASHAIYKTQIFSLLGFFNFIIFTSAVANIPTIRNVLNFFKVEKGVIDRWLQFYSDEGKGQLGIYFFFDCEKMTFNISKQMLFKRTTKISENLFSQGCSTIGELQTIFSKFVENLPEKNEANSIFSILANCVPNHFISKHDLTVSFRNNRKKREKIVVSIVDYIISILSVDAIVRPPLIALHRFVRTFCKIPSIFIRNKLFS